MRIQACVLTLVLSLVCGAPRAFAQTPHAAPTSALDAAVQAQVQTSDADRRFVQQLLERGDIKAVASRAGIDLRSVGAAVDGMDQVTLAQVTEQARAVDRALAGGQSSVTIGTTTIIIGLLVLILLIVALN